MGNDPKTSVVNRDCQIHDVDNVYVIDASVHVTNGGFNPALTILANAYRASANLLSAWKGSKVRVVKYPDCGSRSLDRGNGADDTGCKSLFRIGQGSALHQLP